MTDGKGAEMTLSCRKSSVRESAAQWNLDALVETPGGDLLPCFVSALTAYCTVQAAYTGEGEALLSRVSDALGAPPSSPPQTVKGGSCGGEEEEAEIPFTGSMISATWAYPKERRPEVIAAFRSLFRLGEGATR